MSNTSNYANQASTMGVSTVGTITTNNTSGPFLISNPHGNHWGTGAINQNQLYQIHQSNPPILEVNGKMTLNGRDMEERLRNIEKVLLIPERDVKLENKHPKLKKLYDEYMAALGKYRTFESLKGDE